MKASLLADEDDLDLILDHHSGKQPTKMDTSQEICSPRLPISKSQGQKRCSGTVANHTAWRKSSVLTSVCKTPLLSECVTEQLCAVALVCPRAPQPAPKAAAPAFLPGLTAHCCVPCFCFLCLTLLWWCCRLPCCSVVLCVSHRVVIAVVVHVLSVELRPECNLRPEIEDSFNPVNQCLLPL